MSIHFSFIIAGVLFATNSPGQTVEQPFCQATESCCTSAYIKGHQFQSFFTKQLFQNDFEIVYPDTSVKIISFVLTWDEGYDTATSIYETENKGSKVSVSEKKLNGSKIDSGSLITVDNLVVEKNGRRHKVPSLIFYITSEKMVTANNKNLPACCANFKDFYNNDAVPYTVFSKNQKIQISNPDYSLLGFTASWEIGENVYKEKFQGETLLIDKNKTTKTLRKLKPGCLLIIDEIQVEKDGEIYQALPFRMYCK